MSAKPDDVGIRRDEMIALVRRILDGADLSQTTGKIVRQKVLEELGDRAGSDQRAIKRSVRDALNIVLQGTASSSSTAAQPSAPSAKREKRENETGQEPEKAHENGINGVARAKGQVKGKVAIVAELPAVPVDASEHDADVEDEEGDSQVREAKARRMSGKKRRLRTVIDEDDDDDDFDPDADEAKPSPPRARKIRAVTPSPSRPKKPSDMLSSPARSKKTASPSSSPARPARRVRPAKRSRSDLFTSEKHLEKLRSVCKQVGCTAPPSLTRGKTVPEKCAAVVDYLRQKGVDAPNPTLLTRKEIAVHRARLEQEKELAGLDTRCVYPYFLFTITNSVVLLRVVG